MSTEKQRRGKIHYRYYGAGRIACNPYRRWQELTSTRNKDKVDCANCRRVFEKEDCQ